MITINDEHNIAAALASEHLYRVSFVGLCVTGPRCVYLGVSQGRLLEDITEAMAHPVG